MPVTFFKDGLLDDGADNSLLSQEGAESNLWDREARVELDGGAFVLLHVNFAFLIIIST